MKFKCLMVWVFLLILNVSPFQAKAQPVPANPLPPGQNNKDGTNEVTVPKTLEDRYTNSVGMQLVKVANGVWAAKYEVTQKEYQKIMGKNPSEFSGETRPVENVSWNEAVDFCLKMTAFDLKEKKLPEGYQYMLPTEEEWEAMVGDAGLDKAVVSLGTPRSGTSPVGSLTPNNLGLYDMRGNVMEFTVGDPNVPYRVLRGGSWQDWIEVNLRVAFRTYCQSDERKNTFGFRCILKGK